MDEQEMLDEYEDSLDQQGELQESQIDSYSNATIPEAQEQQNLYNWFWKVVGLQKPFESVKVGNLDSGEIGLTNISVRDCMNLAHLGAIFHHKTFSKYFATQAKVISATSMAKKGWFMDLSISQKKVRERKRNSGPITNEKWKIFNRSKQKTAE